MSNRPVRTSINDVREIPAFASESEEHEFWKTHEVSDELAAAAEPIPEDELPPVRACSSARTRTVALRLDDDVLRRIRTLARHKGTGYEALLTAFIMERLYEEEKREGIVGQR